MTEIKIQSDDGEISVLSFFLAKVHQTTTFCDLSIFMKQNGFE